MEIKISYSEESFDTAVKYLIKHNIYFKNKEEIERSILDNMKELASNRDRQFVSTGGYILIPDAVEESIDYDMNEVYIQIFVDPAIKSTANTIKDFFINVPAADYWKKI